MHKTSDPTNWGKITDAHNISSHFGILDKLEEHSHSASKVYPTLSNGIVLTTGTPAWTLGSFIQIVPVSTILNDFDIHFISIENISAVGVYEIVLYYGDTDIECGRVRFTKTAVMDTTMNIKMMTNIIPSGSKIRAKIASSTGNADTVTISLLYHIY